MPVTRRVNEIFPVFAGNTDHKTLINIFFLSVLGSKIFHSPESAILRRSVSSLGSMFL